MRVPKERPWCRLAVVQLYEAEKHLHPTLLEFGQYHWWRVSNGIADQLRRMVYEETGELISRARLRSVSLIDDNHLCLRTRRGEV